MVKTTFKSIPYIYVQNLISITTLIITTLSKNVFYFVLKDSTSKAEKYTAKTFSLKGYNSIVGLKPSKLQTSPNYF